MKQNGNSKHWKKMCAAGLLIASGVTLWADENDEVWLTGTVKYKMTDHLSLKLAKQTRIRNEDRAYRHTDLGVGYSLNKSWSIRGSFRAVEKKDRGGLWQSCDGYLLDLVRKAERNGFQLKSRMRLSYFDPGYSADCSTDFRPRFDLSPAAGITEWQLTPYLADEVMIDLEEKNLYRNRLLVGLKVKPAKQLSLDLFLMQECTETNAGWSEHWNSSLAVTLTF